MRNEERLEKLLDSYIQENKNQKDTYNKNIVIRDLYKELLLLLSGNYDDIKNNKMAISLLFTSIYKDSIYLDEFYKILVNIDLIDENRKRFKKLCRDIKDDYQKLDEELKTLELQLTRSKYIVSSANRVKLCFKYRLPITDNKYEITNIKKIISYYEIQGVISSKEEILLINEIETYNRKIGFKDASEQERNYIRQIYSDIPNIINAGFQPHDEIEIDEERKPTLEKFKKEIMNYIEYLSDDEIILNIEKYRNYNIEDKEYNYIIIQILESYLDDLLAFYELLIDKEVYIKRSARNEIIKGYYSTLDKYLFLLNYYNEINRDKIIENDEDVQDEVIEMVDNTSNILVYAHSSINYTKSKLILDMKDIPYEYYDRVYQLINDFKNNELSHKQIKKLTAANNFLEIKDDQVRIVFKHISDNIYAIMGVFAKKANNDMMMFKTLINRIVPDISDDKKYQIELGLAEKTEKELEELVQEKGRKGTR